MTGLDERRSPISLDAIASEAIRTIRAIEAVKDKVVSPGTDVEGLSDSREGISDALQQSTFTERYVRSTLRARLVALGDIASFEPARTLDQAAFQLFLAIPCLEIVKGEAFDPDLSAELRDDLERHAEKATRLLYSAAAVLMGVDGGDLARLHKGLCDPSDNMNAVTDQILSAF